MKITICNYRRAKIEREKDIVEIEAVSLPYKVRFANLDLHRECFDKIFNRFY